MTKKERKLNEEKTSTNFSQIPWASLKTSPIQLVRLEPNQNDPLCSFFIHLAIR